MRRTPPTSIRPTKKRSITHSSPAPYKGLNTVDSLAAMDPAYALSCINFIAKPKGLGLREGYRKWATGLPTTPTTIVPYNSNLSTYNKLFAVCGSAIYDVTASGVVGGPVVTGLDGASPYWQFASQAGVSSGKSFIGMVNGSDYPRLYDGTSWITCSQVASPTNPGEMSILDNAGNAVDIQQFTDIVLHQQRVWFVKKNSSKAYYLDIAQAGGTLYPFDFGAFFPRGGKLYKLASWATSTSSDAGVQATLVAISDIGDVAIYGGTSPSDASTWKLIANRQLGAPIGMKCTYPFAGDLLYLSDSGLYPLSKYLETGTLTDKYAITAQITPTISALTKQVGTYPGWEIISHPGSNNLLLNVPQNTPDQNYQFCFNVVTQGWTQFLGIPAASWGLYNKDLYFGGSSNGLHFIAKAFIGYSDGADINGYGGNNIVATALSAYDHMNGVSGLGIGVPKHVKFIKPYLVTGSISPKIKIGVNVDFDITPIIGSAGVNPVSGTLWDATNWDAGSSLWGGSLITYNQWATPRCYSGEALAVSLSLSATAETLWVGTAWAIEPGKNLL